MTEDEIRARIEELQKLREQKLADVNAIGGALQDCEFWLNRLLDPPPAEVQGPRLVTDGDAK